MFLDSETDILFRLMVWRKILTNHPDDEPHAVLELMDDTFYVRHRQSTVLPFLFKHLREHQEIRKRA